MRIYGLIGYPLSHSFSKQFFADKFYREGIHDAEYRNFPLTEIGALAGLLSEQQGLCGLNVTIPYKEQVIPFLNTYNDVVRDTGACNCIRIENGNLSGYNTDAVGFSTSLQEQLKPHHTKALILGKGGAAKAVAYVLSKLGIAFLYVVRRQVNEADTILYDQVDAAVMAEHSLIVNTTPAGMYPDIGSAPAIPYQWITSKHYLYDLVYNPEKTLFLRNGELLGATIKNGHDMLVIQAEESWKIWNSISA